MMSFYFIDDDKTITNILKLIVNTRGLGVCCGSAENAAEALADLPVMRPDIVLVDFLMPELDGISFIKQASGRSLFSAVSGCFQGYDCFCL